MITRRIHHEYIRKTEQFIWGRHSTIQNQKKVDDHNRKDHKFSIRKPARQTICGYHCAEMRKYYVSLLVVDQRPSCIDQDTSFADWYQNCGTTQ